jgi:hypothetical protein
MAAKKPTNTIRLVTRSLTPRQLRALTAVARLDITVPKLLVNATIIPLSAKDDLSAALEVVFNECVARCKRHGIVIPTDNF